MRSLLGGAMWKCVVLVGSAMLSSNTAVAQTDTCSGALWQLQQYVSQVNYQAQMEYSQGIPMKCGGNPYCAQSLLQQLNYWYQQQSALVNRYYYSIAQQCSSEQDMSAPLDDANIDSPMDESDIADLQVDDEDRTVKIRIPDNPQGFRPK